MQAIDVWVFRRCYRLDRYALSILHYLAPFLDLVSSENFAVRSIETKTRRNNNLGGSYRFTFDSILSLEKKPSKLTANFHWGAGIRPADCDPQKRPDAVIMIIGNAASPSAPKAIRHAGWKLKGVLHLIAMKTVEALRSEFEATAGDDEGM